MHDATVKTGIAADAASRTADTASKSIELTKLQFRTDERPYVFATPKYDPNKLWVTSNDGSEEIQWTVGINNKGKTPAGDVLFTPSETKSCLMDKCEEEIKNFAPKWLPQKSGDTMPVDVPSVVHTGSDRTFSSEKMPLIRNGTMFVYVIGAIRYRDIFDPKIAPYETRYCFRYIPTGLPVGTCGIGNSIK